MAIPVTQLHILRLMLQIEQNLSGLQRDMRANAQGWLAAAQAQSIPQATLAQYMNDAAAAYQARLTWHTALQGDAVNWGKVGALWALIGGTASDFSNMMTPITAVANQLGPANKSTYAAIITACNQIITAINAPLSLWPE